MKQRVCTLWSMEGCTTSIVNHPAKMTMPLPDVSTKQTVTKQTVTMADITMCTGDRCPMKEMCYRYTAKASNWQSYFSQSPVLGGTCEYFWRVSAETDETKKKVNL